MSFVKVTNGFQDFKQPASAMSMVAVSTSVLTALGLTIAPSNAYVRIQVQANPVRVTYDGTTPSSTVGESLPALTTLILSLNAFNASKWIREGATDASVFVQPFAF